MAFQYLLPHVGGGWGQAHCWVLKNQAGLVPAGAWVSCLLVGDGVSGCSGPLFVRPLPVGGVRVLVGLLFEICIVDASIFAIVAFSHTLVWGGVGL